MALSKTNYMRVEMFEKGADQPPRVFWWHIHLRDVRHNAEGMAQRNARLVRVWETVEGEDVPANRRLFCEIDGTKAEVQE